MPPTARPQSATQDVFISYSRRDKAFVQTLDAALRELQRDIWVDWEDIMPTEDWWKAIERGIEAANTFVFILTPDSVASEVCRREIDHAVHHHKRLIPLVHRDVDAGLVHPALGAHNWLFLKEGDDFAAGFQRLVAAMDLDLRHVHEHTRLLIRAVDWDRAGRDPSFLLSGQNLLAAERWLQQAAGKDPQPTDLQALLIRTSRQSPYAKPQKRVVLLSGAIATLALTSGHYFGYLQGMELPVFDRLLQLRPPEPPDPRLLIIEMTEADVQARVKRDDLGRGTLSDTLLQQLLTKLEPLKPRVIGVDFYRDFPVDRRLPQLAQQLRQSDRFIALCKYPELDAQGAAVGLGVDPPPEIAPKFIGFNDALTDRDNVLRRYVMLNVPDPAAACTASQAFSLVVAQRYWELSPGGPAVSYQDPLTAEGTDVLKINQTVFPALPLHSLGYQDTDGGYQMLLNYRAMAGGPLAIAARISLGDVLRGKLTAKDVQDRIVLIGVTGLTNVNDYMATPYGSVPGVVIHAHMVSQVLSTLADRRPQLRPWAPWAEGLWIGSWAVIGGLLVYGLRSPQKLLLGGAIAGILLGGSVYGLLIGAALWVPAVPAALALGLTMASTRGLTARQHRPAKPEQP